MNRVKPIVMMLLLAAVLPIQAQQSKQLSPIQIESATGKDNPIVVSFTGVEHDPIIVQARWNAEDNCLSEIMCFVSSWLEANTSGNLQHMLVVRNAPERGELERRITQNPNLIALNADHFKRIKKWSVLGWVQYGAIYAVLLVKEDPQSSVVSTYVLPLARAGISWGQSDALATDAGVYQILDRIADAVMQRHRPKTSPAK
jgi:hypothetical protein